MSVLTLTGVRPYGAAEAVDVFIRDGVIDAVLPAGERAPDGEAVDVAGRWIGPGLWDAHVHFTQHVIRRRRIDLSETTSAADVIAATVAARAADWPLADGMLMGYGFRDGLWVEPATLAALDAAVADVPVVLVSGDLHCGWMNSAAAAYLGVELDETGLLR
ncbi:amidohydrolase family protein [Microbacterium sp. GXF6406]